VEPTFFATPDEFRAWLQEHHATASELLVGFHKKGSGRPSITWPQSVDQALCFGWIDGVRRRIDDTSYSIRFTPRKARSTWSAVNVRRVAELTAAGLMHPAGVAAFERRSDDKTAIYSYEQRKAAKLEPEQERRFKADAKAWAWFQAQAPSYRRTAIHWVISAKREETRQRRLERLISDSAAARPIPPLTPRRGSAAGPA
jgi:uncharacterized protein YdeI (YjbR/CyaY-like superfamily)